MINQNKADISHIDIEYPESLLDAWKQGDYWMLESSRVSEYIKSILLKKAKNRPGRRYFGEAYVSSTIKMIDGWFNSFKWLSSEKWLTGNSLEPVFEKPFHDTLIKYFGFKNLRNLQNESTALYKGNAEYLHHKKPVAPDLWIIDKKGNHRFIECKLPGDKIGPHQIAGLLLIKENLKVSEKISVSIANLHSC